MKVRIWRIFLLLVSLALIVFLGYSIMQTRAFEQTKARYLDELKTEALPYEQEMALIRQEIALYGVEIEDEETVVIPPRGRVMVGYIVNLSGYMDYIRKQAEKYGFSPVIILDCDNEPAYNKQLIKGMRPSDKYEVVFTDSSFGRSTIDKVNELREAMQGTPLIDSNTFLLHGVSDTAANRAVLLENGFDKCFRLNNSVANEVTEDGFACMGYCDLNSRSANSIQSSLKNAAENAISLIYVFDMKSWQLSSVNQITMNSYLDAITSFAGDGSLVPSTVAESFDNLLMETVQKYEEKDNFMAEKEARLAELEAITQEIYSKWDDIELDRSTYLPWLKYLKK